MRKLMLLVLIVTHATAASVSAQIEDAGPTAWTDLATPVSRQILCDADCDTVLAAVDFDVRYRAHVADRTGAVRRGVPWGLYDAVGFGGLGFGLGMLPVIALNPVGNRDNEIPALAVLVATTVGGVIAGINIGRKASKTIASGGQLRGAHRAAVVGGTVLAGVTMGVLASGLLINGEGEGTFLGSDERTFATLTIAGGALGFLFVWKHWNEFASRSVQLQPVLLGKKRYGLRMSLAARVPRAR